MSTNFSLIYEIEYNDIKMILHLYENIDISEYLNESECEYLQDDMRWLSEYYKKI